MNKEFIEVHYHRLRSTINVLLENYSYKVLAYDELEQFGDNIALNYLQDKCLLNHFMKMQEDLNVLSELIDIGIDNIKHKEKIKQLGEVNV